MECKVKGWKVEMRGRDQERKEEIGREGGMEGGSSIQSSLSLTRKSNGFHFRRLEPPSLV